MKDERKGTILTGTNPKVAADGPGSIIIPGPDLDEIRRLFGRPGDDKGLNTVDLEIDQSIAPAGNFQDEEPSDQITSQAHELQELIESIAPQTAKS